MATAPPAPAPKLESIGHGPIVMPPTSLPPGVHPGYSIGETDRMHDSRIVAYAVMLRANFKVRDREFSGSALGLHEVVFMRKFYEELGGSITLDPTWPAGLRRLIPLTQDDVQRELKRFNVTFIIPREHGLTEITPMYLGTEESEQLRRLHVVMKNQFEAWTKILAKATDRLDARDRANPDLGIVQSLACDHISARELEELANLADPSRDGLAGIVLDEIGPLSTTTTIPTTEAAPAKTLDEIMAQAEKESDAKPDAAQALVDKLVANASVDNGQAMEIASLVEMAGPGVTLSDDDIIRVLGSKAKLAGVKRVLKG